MKTFTTTILALTIGVITNATAAHRGSVLHLTVAGRAPYMVRLDNGWARSAERDIVFDNLEPGYHQVEVIRNTYGYGYYGNQVMNRSTVFVPECSSVLARIERGGYINVVNVVSMEPVYPAGPAVCEEPVFFPGTGCGTVTGCNPVPVVAPVVCQPAIVPLCDREFLSIRDAIARSCFESTRMEIARDLLHDRYLTTAQVMSLMELFDFDSNRLEIAKYAYSRTVDRNRYHEVFALFTFDSNVRELSRYMYSHS